MNSLIGIKKRNDQYPKGSMYGIFAYIYHRNQPDVGKYTNPMDPMKNCKLGGHRPR